jgi:hypothetical protein
MRTLLYLLSLLLALPGIGLAAAFLVLGGDIVTRSPASFVGVLLDTGAWLLPWGLLACIVAFVALVAGGLITRFRRLASSCVAALAAGSSIAVLILMAANFSAEQLAILCALLASIWFATGDRTRNEAPACGNDRMQARSGGIRG